MKKNFFLRYAVLLVVQILLCNFFHLTPYIMLTILPAMVLCIPAKVGTTPALFIAFASALAVDLLAEGLPGINVLALVPVAYCRRGIWRIIFGAELIARGEDFSVGKNGASRVIFSIFLAQSIFLLIYILADGSGARPFVFNLLRFACSLAAGILVSYPAAYVLCPDDRK